MSNLFAGLAFLCGSPLTYLCAIAMCRRCGYYSVAADNLKKFSSLVEFLALSNLASLWR